MDTLRRTAAEIAAAAVYELYPDVALLGGSETDVGFVYDFVFPHPIHTHLIEEKMRQIVREKRPIRTLEMVPFSASELLKAKGLKTRAEAIPDEDLVEIIQMGSFHDLSLGPHLKNTAELAAFKIEAEALPDQKMRLSGWCHHSKEELKQFLKRLEIYTDPIRLGEMHGFWKGEIWFSKGLQAREKLIQILKREWFQGAFEILGPFRIDPLALHLAQRKKKVVEVSPLSPCKTQIWVSFFGPEKEEEISFLHLIGKTLTILGFDHSIAHVGSRTDFVIEDGMGRKQILVHVERRGKDLQLSAQVESILEGMLEKNLIGMLENQ